MKFSMKPLCLSLFFLLAATSSIRAQEKRSPDIQKDIQKDTQQNLQKSCRGFVQGFYDWYVPKWLTDDINSDVLFKKWEASRDPLKQKKCPLSAELTRRLKEDRAAQDKVKGELVGLDFDPFIGGNGGPMGRYVVCRITSKAGHYLAEVYPRPGVEGKKPVVAAEVAFENERWIIVNFHYYIYEGGELTHRFDLLNTLKALREERRKNSK
jgi:hypothetical protein